MCSLRLVIQFHISLFLACMVHSSPEFSPCPRDTSYIHYSFPPILAPLGSSFIFFLSSSSLFSRMLCALVGHFGLAGLGLAWSVSHASTSDKSFRAASFVWTGLFWFEASRNSNARRFCLMPSDGSDCFIASTAARKLDEIQAWKVSATKGCARIP